MLVHIQANLDQDLSLEALANRVGLSLFHFHRLFRSAVGETLKQHTQRLRLEQAASRLVINDAAILDVALDSGFHSHETFSRQFQTTIPSYSERLSSVGQGRNEAKLGFDASAGGALR